MARLTRQAIFAVLLPLLPPLMQRAAASTRGLPHAVFPPHTDLHVHSPVSNATIDCTWSFAVCDELTGVPDTNSPAKHTRTMKQLHRIGGWEEDGTVPSGLGFVLWLNRFPSPSLSRAACIDLARAQRGVGFVKRAYAFPGVGGAKAWTEYLFGGATVNLICTWKGAIEIESMSYWPTGQAAAGAAARRYQRAQIEAALRFLRGGVASLSADVSLTVTPIQPINVPPSRAIRVVEVVAPDLDVRDGSEIVIAVDRDTIADRLEQQDI